MDLFNKKKVKKLEEEILLLKKEVEIKDNVLRNINTPKNTTIEESLTKQNENLLNWILKLIEHNGFEIPEQVPYFKMAKIQPRYYDPSEMCREIQGERYMIPSIEIRKIK